MTLSIKSIFISLLIATAVSQIGPNLQATNTFTYLPGVDSTPSLVSVPKVQPGGSTRTTNSAPSITTASSNSLSSTSSSGTNTPSNNADPIAPNPSTLSNILKKDLSTTNPTATPNLNTGFYEYNTANTAFSAVSQISNRCNGQTTITYVAFRQYSTQFYMTPNLYFLSLIQNTSPNQQQLFTAIQNIDCTWSFKTNDGLYLSLNTAFSYLTLSSTLSVGERFYLERKQDWIYIESANSYRYFWTATNGIVLVTMNFASRFIMEVWPNLNAGWN